MLCPFVATPKFSVPHSAARRPRGPSLPLRTNLICSFHVRSTVLGTPAWPTTRMLLKSSTPTPTGKSGIVGPDFSPSVTSDVQSPLFFIAAACSEVVWLRLPVHYVYGIEKKRVRKNVDGHRRRHLPSSKLYNLYTCDLLHKPCKTLFHMHPRVIQCKGPQVLYCMCTVYACGCVYLLLACGLCGATVVTVIILRRSIDVPRYVVQQGKVRVQAVHRPRRVVDHTW